MCSSEAGDEVDGGAGSDTGVLDADGDDVPDGQDNCAQLANGNQDNEDGDAFGDVCDACPPFADDGADADNDTVGDACDPNPMTPGDQLVFFEGFAHGIPSGWTAQGAWSTADGALVSTANGDNLNKMVIPVTHFPRQTIYSRATITGLTASSGGAIGIVDSYDATGSVGVQCGGFRIQGAEYFGIVNAGNGTPLDGKGHAFDVGTVYNLKFTRTNDYSCITVDSGGAMSVNDGASASGPYFGFRNRIASGAFDWILLVRSP